MFKKNCALMITSLMVTGIAFANTADKASNLNYDEILYFNMQDAMMNSAQGKDAQKRVEAEERKYGELAQKEQQRMMQLKNDLDTRATMVNADERRKMEKELADLQRDFQNKMQDWKYEIQYTMQKETEILIKDIEQAASALAQQTGKAAIADTASGRIIYLREDKNSTNDIVAFLDQQYTVKLAQHDKQKQNTIMASKDAKKTVAA